MTVISLRGGLAKITEKAVRGIANLWFLKTFRDKANGSAWHSKARNDRCRLADKKCPGRKSAFAQPQRNGGAARRAEGRSESCFRQQAGGFRVTPQRKILRRSWAMTMKQYRTPNVRVGTVKKSIAAIAWRWLPGDVRQRRVGFGVLGTRRSQRETVGSETSNPSLRSSP